MWKIYAASEAFLLIAAADRVLRHLVVFLPVFLHWIHRMKYSYYQHSFVIFDWLVDWVLAEKSAARQKEIGNHRFKKYATLSKLTSPCWTMKKVLLLDGFPSCISTAKLE